MTRVINESTRDFHYLVNHRRQFNFTTPQLESIVCDAIQVKQIVNEPDHMAQLALDSLVCLVEDRAVAVCAFEDLEHVAHWSQWISELVSECRQTLVLTAIIFGEVCCQQAQVVFHPFSFGNIPHDLGSANHIAVIVFDRRYSE